MRLTRLDDLARSTGNYAAWLEGPAATTRQVGVHGFRFDAHEQRDPVTLDVFHALVCLRGGASICRMMNDSVQEFRLGPGDVLVNPMAVPMRWSWVGAVEVLNLAVHPGYLDDVVRESLGGTPKLRPLALPWAPDHQLAELGLELQRELATPQLLGAQRGTKALGERIALHVLRRYVEVERGGNDRAFGDEERRRLEGYVDEHLDGSLRVEHLAALVHLGEHHFTRTFRATFGKTPQSWVRERRLDRARALVMTTASTISDIAMETGFSDQSHLTRCFRAEFGATPAALRRGRS